MSENTVYLAILEDRHTDDDIRVFRSLSSAKNQIDEWQRYYDHVTDYENEFHGIEKTGEGDGYCLHLWQADEEQEEGLVMSILEKEVHP